MPAASSNGQRDAVDAGRLERVRLDASGLDGLVAKRPRCRCTRPCRRRLRPWWSEALNDATWPTSGEAGVTVNDGRRRRRVDGAASAIPRWSAAPRRRCCYRPGVARIVTTLPAIAAAGGAVTVKRGLSVGVGDDLADRQGRCRGRGAQRQPLAGHRPVLRVADGQRDDRLRGAVARQPSGVAVAVTDNAELGRSGQARGIAVVERAAGRPETRDQYEQPRLRVRAPNTDLHHHPRT